MKTEASLVAESIRLKQWGQQIRECQNRPAGLIIDDWCRKAGDYGYRCLDRWGAM